MPQMVRYTRPPAPSPLPTALRSSLVSSPAVARVGAKPQVFEYKALTPKRRPDQVGSFLRHSFSLRLHYYRRRRSSWSTVF